MGSVVVAGRLSVAAGRLLVEGELLPAAAAAADGIAGVVEGVSVSVDRSAVGGVVAVAAEGIGFEAALSVVVPLALAAVDTALPVAPAAAVTAAGVVAPAVAEAEENVLALALTVSSLSMSVTCTRKNASTTGSSFDSRDVRVDCGLLELSDLPCSGIKER
jgi:hypothetical protein